MTDNYLPEDKGNVLQAQKSAIKTIRAIVFGVSAFYISSIVGIKLALIIAYCSTGIHDHNLTMTIFDTHFINWLRVNSKEPILGKFGLMLGKFGEIARLFESELKRDFINKKLMIRAIPTTILSKLIIPIFNINPVLGCLATLGTVSLAFGAIEIFLKDLYQSVNNISSSIGKLQEAKSPLELSKAISHIEEAYVQPNNRETESTFDFSKERNKIVIAAIVGASCFLAISALSISTGGIAPSVAIAVAVIVAASAYLGYEPAQKALSSFTDFCSSSYKKLESFLSKALGKSKPTQNIQSEINELVADNSTEDQRYLTDYTKQFEETLTSHGVDQEYAKIIIKEELTYDKKGATSEAKHQHAEEEIQLLKWTTDLIKSGDNKQQDNVRIEVTAETHGKVIELGKKLTKIGIKNAFEITSKEEQKLSTLSEPELLKKEIKNITETTKLLEKITSPKTTPPSPGRTR